MAPVDMLRFLLAFTCASFSLYSSLLALKNISAPLCGHVWTFDERSGGGVTMESVVDAVLAWIREEDMME